MLGLLYRSKQSAKGQNGGVHADDDCKKVDETAISFT
jgi:hypothetical protein